MVPVLITAKKSGEFNYVIGGSHLVTLHHLALLSHPLVDSKFPSAKSPEIVAQKLIIILGRCGQKEILAFPGNSSEKGPKNGSDSAKLFREKKGI